MFTIDSIQPKELAAFYRNQLTDNILPFWLNNALDQEHGGWITSLDRKGEIFNTDKSVWFQGRATWTFATMAKRLGANPAWEEAAALGYRFMRDHCYDSDGRMFFQVTQEGKPIQKRRYWYSESFAAIAAAAYYDISGNTEALKLARSTWETMVRVYKDPSLSVPKFYPETVQMKGLGGPMIQLITAQTLRALDKDRADLYSAHIIEQIKLIRTQFMKHDLRAVLENVGPDGSLVPGPKGRLVNPGHVIEAAWFVMDEAEFLGDKAMMEDALKMLDWSMDLGIDKEHGGLLYFVDIEGRPCEALEWDMKLWWPHNEALIALIKAYKHTGLRKYHDAFVSMHNYSFEHFSDPLHGEWYGYLHRDGSVANHLKGNLFKGPFHLPRALLLVHETLSQIAAKEGIK